MPSSDSSPPSFRRLLSLTEDDAFWQQRDEVIAEREQSQQRAADRESRATRRRRLAQLPTLYRERFRPELSLYPPEVLDRLRHWDYRNAQGQGIGLVGRSGLGKTRLLTALLRSLPVGCDWMFLPAAQLSHLVAQQWSRDVATATAAAEQLRQARQVQVLMLDDLGDERSTEAVGEELKDLIETRTAHLRPILWTSNLTEAELHQRHAHRGPAIARRLAEFTWTGGG